MSRNLLLDGLFRSHTKDGVRAEMTHREWWAGKLSGSDFAKDNGFGREEFSALAAKALERFEAEHGATPREAPVVAHLDEEEPAPLPTPRRSRPASHVANANALSELAARLDARLGPDQTDRIGSLPRASIEALANSSESSSARSLARDLLAKHPLPAAPAKTLTVEQRAILDRAKGSAL